MTTNDARRRIFGLDVFGIELDPETRCAHYHREDDIVAIKFKCCDEWFACYECHAALADHPAKVWPTVDFNKKVILCGACGQQLSATEYFACESKCPSCDRTFNPSCTNHRHLYFQVS